MQLSWCTPEYDCSEFVRVSLKDASVKTAFVESGGADVDINVFPYVAEFINTFQPFQSLFRLFLSKHLFF